MNFMFFAKSYNECLPTAHPLSRTWVYIYVHIYIYICINAFFLLYFYFLPGVIISPVKAHMVGPLTSCGPGAPQSGSSA